MNSGWTRAESPFHKGEQVVQTRMGVREKIESLGRRMVREYLPEQHRTFYSLLPFVLLGTTDEQSWPWVSLVASQPGFIQSLDKQTLKIAAQPLFGSPLDNQLKVGDSIGLLGFLPANRRRNRLTGKVIAVGHTGFAVAIAQTFGNCPQYIQTREIEILPEISKPRAEKSIKQGNRLDEAAKVLIKSSDTFFIATAYRDKEVDKDNPAFGADVSHRGGKPGFVRIEGDRTLTFPDFTGNFIFNTVGNILVNPKAGLLFIDFNTQDLLYITGRAEIIWEGKEKDAFLGAERLIRIQIESWKRVENSLPLRFEFGEYSPNLKATGSWEQVHASTSS